MVKVKICSGSVRQLSILRASSLTDSLTWDRNQITLAVIIDILKDSKLKLEYYINDEDIGGKDIDNNEFLMQLEIKF